MAKIMDLPDHIIEDIVAWSKDQRKIAPLRLVCKPFDLCVGKMLFNTISIYTRQDSSGEPFEWFKTMKAGKARALPREDMDRLQHQIYSLYTKRADGSLRNVRQLKLFVSEVFHLRDVGGDPCRRSGSEKKTAEAGYKVLYHLLKDILPEVIQSFERLEQVTWYLTNGDPEEVVNNISRSLSTLSQVRRLDIEFLESRGSLARFPVPRSTHLESLKVCWPFDYPNSVGGQWGASVYQELFGYLAGIQGLKKLEMVAKYPLPRQRMVELPPLPQLEELVLVNVPVQVKGQTILVMRRLRELRFGGFGSATYDPYDGVFKSLKVVQPNIEKLEVDVVGEALVEYLASRSNLKELSLNLGHQPNDFWTRELFQHAMKRHTWTLKVLRVNLDPQSNPFDTWFFDYWRDWAPKFGRLEELEVATPLNIGYSEFDRPVFGMIITDTLTRFSTLKRLHVRHMHENDSVAAERGWTSYVREDTLLLKEPVVGNRVPCTITFENFQCKYQAVFITDAGAFGGFRFDVCAYLE